MAIWYTWDRTIKKKKKIRNGGRTLQDVFFSLDLLGLFLFKSLFMAKTLIPTFWIVWGKVRMSVSLFLATSCLMGVGQIGKWGAT